MNAACRPAYAYAESSALPWLRALAVVSVCAATLAAVSVFSPSENCGAYVAVSPKGGYQTVVRIGDDVRARVWATRQAAEAYRAEILRDVCGGE